MSTKYVYVIRCKVKFEDYCSQDYEYTFRVYSSLRKALDCLELYKEIHTAEFLNAGYDVECDAHHWVDYREDGHYSFLNIKNGSNIKTYHISREILF